MFREETPRKGRRHNKREVSHAALQQYGLETSWRQVQKIRSKSKKSSISRAFRLILRHHSTILLMVRRKMKFTNTTKSG